MDLSRDNLHTLLNFVLEKQEVSFFFFSYLFIRGEHKPGRKLEGTLKAKLPIKLTPNKRMNCGLRKGRRSKTASGVSLGNSFNGRTVHAAIKRHTNEINPMIRRAH